MIRRPGGEAISAGPDAPWKEAILDRFRLGAGDLLGAGSESWVYALDDERILRIRRQPAELDRLRALASFLERIAGRLPFDTPEILSIEADGATIERRLAGRPMTEALDRLEGDGRRRALSNYFGAAVAIRSITMDDQPFGALLDPDKGTAPGWRTFLSASIDRSAMRYQARLEAAFGNVATLVDKARERLAAVPESPDKTLAHGDFLPGNVMIGDDLEVSAVLDFGAWTLVAEPSYDATGAAMFCEVTNECRPADWTFLRSLLLDGSNQAAIDVMTAYRVYFAFTLFDPMDAAGLYPKLYPWNVRTLGGLSDGTVGDWVQESGVN
ncbi:MAG: aminoglycoside phosphotransferase family protein [Bauldia sp.]|uniref:phosphotransferase family protein n=1 Tax=Bauldia sp. TaxID=2575872 RepID=UPI001D684EF9|nr:aminoglycoside phosphotransferase family protein [Bauldia sp.]